jgi:ParB-like chromosome segregation protein Spo0J
VKVKWVDITKLKPYEKNPRQNKIAVGLVANSIKEFGWQQPIVVDPEMVVIVGHTRLLAAEKLGLEKVPVLIAEKLTPAQIKAYRIADNRTGAEADWDSELLRLELEDLQLEEYDLGLTGFNEQELEKALHFEITQLAPDADPEKTASKLKKMEIPDFQPMDIIEIGPHQLIVGYEEPGIVKNIIQLVQEKCPKLKITNNGKEVKA